MRIKASDRLFAGTILALAVVPLPGASFSAFAAPNILQSEPPPPLMLRAQPRRDAAPTRTAPQPQSQSQSQPLSQPVAEPVNARAQAAPPAAAPSNEPAAERSVVDRLFGASDAQITDKIRDTIAAKRHEAVMARPQDRTGAETFYKSRNYAPLWIKDGALTSRAKATIARLKNAGADALDPSDYPAPDFSGGADALAEADLRLTNSVLTYARHLQVGRIAPTRVSAEVSYPDHTPDPADILRRVSDASNVDAAFDGFNPPHAGFKALRDKFTALRANASADEDTGRIPDGPAVKPGMKDPRVPMLGVSGRPDDLTYDNALAAAVNRVQARADIKGKGILDDRAVALINGPKASQQVATIEANMERWRWLPRDLGRAYVMVNVPDFTLKVVKDNELVWRTKIVSGKPQTPTPLVTASMESVVVNPSWFVPQSIIQNELLPQYEHDPLVFERMGLEVKRGPDGNINVVQPPGAANALGRIKFNFPNKFQVYLHDTPEKRLFSYEKRAFSHGCMRVEDPTKFGEVMLHLAMAGPTPNSPQLLSMFGHEEKIFKLQTRPMVHLTYQTAYVDDGGKLVMRDDIYGFDSRIHTIVTTDERKIADVAPPQDPKREQATAKSNQEILRRVERREAGNPFAFFERLFR